MRRIATVVEDGSSYISRALNWLLMGAPNLFKGKLLRSSLMTSVCEERGGCTDLLKRKDMRLGLNLMELP
jgi:hypothetical protein